LPAKSAPKGHEQAVTPATGTVGSNAGVVPFTPPSGEFCILMPSKVTSDVLNEKNFKVPTYQGRAGIVNYVVTDVSLGKETNALDSYLKGFLRSITSRTNSQAELSDTSGQGWTGKICSFKRDGKESLSGVVAKANGTNIIYSAIIDAPVSSEQAKNFLASLVIYPDKALEAHKNDPGSGPSAGEIGQTIGSIIGMFVGIGLGVYFVKKAAAKKKLEQS